VNSFRKLIKNLPTLITALVFAIAVWVLAVSQADPNETRIYPQSIAMEIVGLDPGLMIVNEIDEDVTLTLRAPTTILDELENERSLINVTLDLSGLEAGVHTLTPQVTLGLSPAEVVRMDPSSVFVKLESVISESFPVEVKTVGNTAIGYELSAPELSTDTVLVTGPQSLVDAVDMIAVEVDIEDVTEDINRELTLTAYDAEDNEINALSISPSTIQVNIPVIQRDNFKSVVVKIVTSGQIAAGYKLTEIISSPLTVMIYSADANLVNSVPGYVETTPISLDGANESLEIRATLNLPEGVTVVGSQNITVQIGIAPVESSINFNNIPVQFEGLGAGLSATTSPDTVDVYLSGPLYLLEALDPATLVVAIDLTDRGAGTYQLAPEVLLEDIELNVDAILPNTLEVTITAE
jgi:YbbR domain-containing protein